MDKRVLFLVLLISTPVIPRRSSSGGGSGGGSNFNRGSSGARGNTGQNFGGQPGGFQQGGSNFRPQTGPSGNNFNQGGNFQPRPNPQPGFGGNNNFGRPTNNFGGPSTFQQTGTGSRASSGSWKTALAAGALGAVGGVVAWEAGKAIIRNAQEPFNHGGRNYYFDNNGQKQLNGQQMCSMPLSELQKIEAPATTTTTTTVAPSATVDPNASTTTVAPTGENVLQTIQYPGGDRPKTVTWGCKAGSEVCCGTDCCPAPVNISNQPPRPSSYGNDRSTVGTIAALIVVFLLLFCCCGCFIIYKCFGYSCDQNKRDEYNQGQGEYPMQQYGQQPNYSQQQQYDHQGGYPPQNQYPNQGYPPQPQYPNQSYPNQPYPAQPYPQHPQY